MDKYTLDQNELNKGYVLGFLFSEDLKNVLLMKKNRPAKQAGKLNGIGGKIEPGESHVSCMIREFREEAGLEFRKWVYHNSFPTGPGEHCQVFYGIGDVRQCRQTTDEKLMVMSVAGILDSVVMYSMVPNTLELIQSCYAEIYEQQNPVYNDYDVIANYKPITENK